MRIFDSMNIGSKIRKIREIKGYSQENMAIDLDMSVTGYGKIERNQVAITVDKLEQISKVLGVQVDQILGFDESIAFNNFNSSINNQIGHSSFPPEIEQLYKDKIQLLEEKIVFLQEKLNNK